jgi:GDP-L-fucose synthase
MTPELLKPSHKVFVAGHRGLVGSAIVETLRRRGYERLLLTPRAELDLEDGAAVRAFFERERPDAVIVAAALVGGIHANDVRSADFIHVNLQIQNNVIWNAHRSGVKRLVFLGSSCIYPKMAPQPMPETCLLGGPLEPTNRAYALAKIAGLELVHDLRKQYGRDYFSVMPTNLYGPGDNFDLESSHVLPALVRKLVDAAASGAAEAQVWGTGKPLREFMHSTDCAEAIVHLAETLTPDRLAASPVGQAGWSHVNVGTGDEVAIGELARMIARITGFKGELRFVSDRPDGTPRKLLDTTMLRSLGWSPRIPLQTGLEEVVAWYLQHRGDHPGVKKKL